MPREAITVWITHRAEQDGIAAPCEIKRGGWQRVPLHLIRRTADERARGLSSRNEPAELPRIAETLAALRGWTLEETAVITTANACAALPRLRLTIGHDLAPPPA